MITSSPPGFGHEHVDNRFLKGGRNIGGVNLGIPANVIHDRSLEARERKVIALVEHGPGELHRLRIAFHRDRVDGRATGISEAEVTSDLVERFTSGVVNCGTQHAVLAVACHEYEKRVSARYQQHNNGKFDFWVLKQRGVKMSFKMVHRNEWDIPDERKSLCCAHSNKKRADESGTNRCRNRVNVIILNARFDE